MNYSDTESDYIESRIDTWHTADARRFVLNFMLVTLWTAAIRPIHRDYMSWFISRAQCCDKLLQRLREPGWEPIEPRMEEGIAMLFKLGEGGFEGQDRSTLVDKIERLSYQYFRSLDRPWSNLVPVGGLTLADWPTPDTIFLAFGPHIGIGDEMILFRVVESLAERYPEADVEIWSYSKTLWDGNPRVKPHYIEDDCLTPFIRAQTLLVEDPTALVGFGDFASEKSYRMLETVPGFHRFFYVDLGSRLMRIVDQENQRIREDTVGHEHSTVYETLATLLNRTGIGMSAGILSSGSYRSIVNSSPRVFLNPHSSKEMLAVQSEWWAEALNELGAHRRIVVTVLAGINEVNHHFALDILNALDPDVVSATIMPPAELDSVLRTALESDIVIGLDTFTAHVNTIRPTRCVTVFFGSSGNSWHVPEAAVLNAQTCDSAIRAGRLAGRLLYPPPDPLIIEALAALALATRRFGESLTQGTTPQNLHRRLAGCRTLIADIFRLDKSAAALFDEFPMCSLESLQGVLGPHTSVEPISPLQAQVVATALKHLVNSNLCRYAHYAARQWGEAATE